MKPHEHKMVAERLHSIFRNAPKGISKPTLKPAAADISGRWDVHVDFGLGEGEHQLLLQANGNQIKGTHIGTVVQGELKGTIDGNKVRFRSSLPFEGTSLGYRFEGTLKGDRMRGLLNPGSTPLATWEAKRHGYA